MVRAEKQKLDQGWQVWVILDPSWTFGCTCLPGTWDSVFPQWSEHELCHYKFNKQTKDTAINALCSSRMSLQRPLPHGGAASWHGWDDQQIGRRWKYAVCTLYQGNRLHTETAENGYNKLPAFASWVWRHLSPCALLLADAWVAQCSVVHTGSWEFTQGERLCSCAQRWFNNPCTAQLSAGLCRQEEEF